MQNYNPITTLDDALGMGLNESEYNRICTHLDRNPNLTELGVFSAMWSEHCSYKSSKRWLMTLPTEGDQVIQGPGENAGVIDIGDGWAAVFKIESHNHPSYIEPYQGSATGVGGILRDVFTMGARPIALLNALRFGDPHHHKTRYLLNGVVAGIGGYGNCIGIPTVGGECNFNASYNGNILVNAMAVGLARTDKIFLSAASGVGNPVLYLGAKTGRDGIHGATMASAEFSDDTTAKRPTVQVGDPFTGKLLMEACLELMASDAVLAIQDMGAAGLTSSSVEMAAKGGLGMEINLDNVPCRETEMSSYEMMLSESQERMLVILKPDATTRAKEIFDKWGLDCATIGEVTNSSKLILKKDGDIVGDIPLDPLVNDAPNYHRPHNATSEKKRLDPKYFNNKHSIKETLLAMLGSHHLASRRWIWEQYDRHVMADTIAASGGDAALVRIHGSERGIAMTTDCTPRYVKADPYQGGMQAVAEAYRNISAIGAKPLALTNNLNFGNPEKPHIMGQIVASVQGIGDAAKALNTPVVSGNVSLYNENNEDGGNAIDPTPVIGMVGVIDEIASSIGIGFADPNLSIIVVGQAAESDWLGVSIYADIFADNPVAAPPPVDLNAEAKHGQFIRDAITKGLISACHDVADGGLLIAVAEMMLATKMGVDLSHLKKKTAAWCFGEGQARYVVATNNQTALTESLEAAGIPYETIGTTHDDKRLQLWEDNYIAIDEMVEAYENFFPNLMQNQT